MPKFIAAALASAALAFPAAAETIRVGMSGGYFPFTFVRQDELQGFEVDFMNAIAAETGDEVAFETMSFSGLDRRARGRPDRHHRQPDHHHPRARGDVRLLAALRLRRRPGGGPRGQRRDRRRRGPARQDASPSTSARTSRSCCASCPTPTRSTSAPTRATSSRTPRSAASTPSSWTGCRPAQVIAESPLPLAARRPALLRDPATPCRSATTRPAGRCATASTPRSPR